jgi:hypothetical protein
MGSSTILPISGQAAVPATSAAAAAAGAAIQGSLAALGCPLAAQLSRMFRPSRRTATPAAAAAAAAAAGAAIQGSSGALGCPLAAQLSCLYQAKHAGWGWGLHLG